jgi:hypothetical protein
MVTSKPSENVLTLNPEKGKKGASMDRSKYELVKSAITDCFRAKPELTKAELVEGVGRRLKGKLEGSVEWSVMAVKLDLEAKGIISRVPRSSPVIHRLVKNGRWRTTTAYDSSRKVVESLHR